MANYTQLNRQDIQKLADNYQLTIKEFNPMEGGNGNSSQLIKTTDHAYVLTICDEKNFEEANSNCVSWIQIKMVRFAQDLYHRL